MKRIMTLVFMAALGVQANSVWVITPVVMTAFVVQASAEQFDRSAILPELAKAAKTAQSALTDYRAANRTAEKAANRIAAGFKNLPRKDRDAAKAKSLCQWEASLKTMSERLETFYGTMASIQAVIEGNVAGGLGAMRERIDNLVTQFSAELVQQERSSAAMLKVYEISPDAAGEMEAQKLNNALDSMEQRKGLIKKLQERRERIATINETIQQKLEGIKAVVGAVEVRIAELKTEAYVVDILKKEHQIELITEEVFGLGTKTDASKIFGGGSSKALDTILNQKTSTGGMSQRELLKLRRGRAIQ